MGTFQRHWSTASPLATGEPFFAILPSNWDASKTTTNRAIFGWHGAGTGADDKSYQVAGPLFDHVRALVEAGYAVLAADFGGNSTWGAPIQGYDRPRDLYTYATGTLGVSPNHIGLMGHSMGGQGVLNYIRNCYANSVSPGKAAWLWSPLTDAEMIYDQPGYVPAYAPGYTDSALLTTSAGVTITAGTATSLSVTGTIPPTTPASGTIGVATASYAFVPVSYSAWSGTTFTIPTSNATSATVASGAKVVTHSPAPNTSYQATVAAAFGLTGAVTAKNAQSSAVLSGATVQASAALPRAWQMAVQAGTITFTIGAFTLTATGLSTTTVANDTLTGVSSAGATVNWSAAAAVTGTYNSIAKIASPIGNIAAFRTAIGTMPIKVATATDDEVLGYNSQAYFISQLALSNVTQRSPAITGGHTLLFPNVPTSEVIAFFNANV